MQSGVVLSMSGVINVHIRSCHYSKIILTWDFVSYFASLILCILQR